MTNENMTTATTGTTEPKKTYRTFEIMQYEYNPKTGEDLHFNRAVIMKALAHKTIKQWIYVRHDRDKNDDGTPKAPHWRYFQMVRRSSHQYDRAKSRKAQLSRLCRILHA